jgi:hypothetical protein
MRTTRGKFNSLSLGSGRLLLLLGLVVLLGSAAAVATLLVNRYVVFYIDQAVGERSVLMPTPFGILPPQRAASGPFSLWAAIYPKSEWEEENSFVFYRGGYGKEALAAQLTVLRFTAKASFQQVDGWYQERLSKRFARTKGWLAGRNDKEDWAGDVAPSPDPGAIVYRRELPYRVQGVILKANDGVISAILYDFQPHER